MNRHFRKEFHGAEWRLSEWPDGCKEACAIRDAMEPASRVIDELAVRKKRGLPHALRGGTRCWAALLQERTSKDPPRWTRRFSRTGLS
jgi:hypothetical protein